MDRGKREKGKSINYYLEGNFNARIGREGGWKGIIWKGGLKMLR